MSVQALCEEILRRRTESLERRIEKYPRNNPIASDIGECCREMVLSILHWEERALPSPELKARFERGSLVEDTVLRELSSLGISVRVERQPFEIRDKKGRLVLRGKVDGFVKWETAEYPMEVKSLDPNVFRQVDSVEDFQRWIWASKYPRQIQAYLYANNLEEGFFLLDDCMGHWKLIPMGLDYAEMEKILQRCERAVEAVENYRSGVGDLTRFLPEYHKDPAVCRRCWAFGRVCTPPVDYHGLLMLTDPEFEESLNRRGELQASHKEYESLDKAIRERVKGKDGLVVGAWLIQGKEVTKTLKAQPATIETVTKYWLPKITKTGE